ncbi:GNAT family N-acetyltransferase [Sphingomonas elodea]|uniref:Putative acetyltransferase n=1 Tax=Sphingomonas elodea TaxID=179878 RepID=Q7X2M7_SPHEL|nr:GNAT family protein [Sphingomonas elodea]AAP57682.1 putative acetyltransferase [Sphingomonas elodea ATCC 31461]
MAIAEPEGDAPDTPVLTSARLRLRPLVAEDADALHPAYADVELMRWWSHAPHADLAQTRAWFAEEDEEGWRHWAITRAGDDAAIGFVAVNEKRKNVSEIGYLLARPHWGTGIAAEALTLVLDQLFLAEGYRRVFADTDPDNVYSRRLLERLGFRLEGVLRAEWETHIGIRDTTLYGLLKEDWTCRPRRT